MGLIAAVKVLEVRPGDFIDYLRGSNWFVFVLQVSYQDKMQKGFTD
ncbi:hypothetical protein [Bartonella sp. CB169]